MFLLNYACRKSYSSALIDGIKRKSRIFVGDSIVRKTDSRLRKVVDVVGCLPRARIEHVTEGVEQVREGKPHTSSNRDEQREYGRHGGYSEEMPESTEEDEASVSCPDHSVRDSTRDMMQEPRIHEHEEDGDQQTSAAAKNKEEDVVFVEQLCDEGVDVYEVRSAPARKRAGVFADRLKQAVRIGLDNVRYLN